MPSHKYYPVTARHNCLRTDSKTPTSFQQKSQIISSVTWAGRIRDEAREVQNNIIRLSDSAPFHVLPHGHLTFYGPIQNKRSIPNIFINYSDSALDFEPILT